MSLDDVYNGIHFPVQGRDNQEKIKYFIKNAIENWDTSYILLVGGSSQCPTRDTHIFVDAQPNPDEEIFVSDLYYADIYDESMAFATWDTNENSVFGEYNWGAQHNYDDVDLYPDVHLGRLACVNGNEVTTSVDKIINYETTRAYTKDWFTDLVVMGGDSFSGDSQHVDEGEYVNDAVIDIMDGFIPDRIWASNGRLNGLVPTGVTEIKNAINDGAGFVDFSGHGNTAVWATHPHESPTWIPTPTGGFYNTHIATLTNGNKLPIVVIGACSVSKFKSDPDCFSWSFVSNSNGGAIGTFGATGLGWAYIGSGVTQGLIEGISLNTFEAYREEGAMTFGEMWSTSITNYIFPGMDDVDYKTIEEWEPLGDPTLAVAEDSQPPEKAATPDGETEGKVGTEYTYTSSTTDPDGDQLYYLFDWGDGTYSGWVGPYNSGETAEASHTWTEQGNYEIKVKAKDENGVQGEWSDPLPIIMPVNYNFFHSLLWEILERLMERFPFLEQIFESMPILSMLLDL